MKRTILLCVLLLCVLLLACAAPEERETRELVALSAPIEQDVTLTLPVFRRVDVTKLMERYTDGFVSASGKLLTFSTETEDPDVALSSLFEDGTLCILAVSEGITAVNVTAIAETGESAVGRVNVTVNSGRRMAVLIVTGVLVVVLLILFGRPNGRKKQPTEAAETPEEPTDAAETPEEPTEAAEKPEETPETAQEYVVLPERSQEE